MSYRLVTSVLGTVFLMVFRDEIKGLAKTAYDYGIDCTFSQIIIDINNEPKCLLAIKEELKKYHQSRCTAQDGVYMPNYNIADGNYKITYQNTSINISINDTQIKLMVFWKDSDFLKEYMNKIYQEHCAPEKVITLYSSQEGKWDFPIFRRPRDVQKINVTEEMKDVLHDVDTFISQESDYENKGIPFRRGYLLEGKPGVGKTLIVEIIAMKHSMPIYIVNMNSKNMTDEVLVNLVSNVPPRSLIVFEELEKQLSTLKQNRNNMISYGGILSAIDGPQRLSHGSIVVMTVNSVDLLDDEFKEPLLREGRIDRHCVLTRKIDT